MTKKVVLIIIDGWGYNKDTIEYDAIANAETIWMDLFIQKFPSLLLYAHGTHVGLPDEQMGNSEVGHLTIGSGRIIPQDLVRINEEISQEIIGKRMGEFDKYKNERMHIVGMLSDGGVHSHIDHIKSLIRNISSKELIVHAVCDGRDTSPTCFLRYADDLNAFCKEISKGRIASVSGRYYTMDRDKRNERTDKSYNMMISGQAESKNLHEYINNSYQNKITDEFIVPALFDEKDRILENEPIIFANFRADRMRQIVKKFEKRNQCFTMTEYDPCLNVNVIFKKQLTSNCLSEVLSKNKIKHLHVAETEKYAHVTYFFSGGKEEKFDGEDRVMVPSPKVASYDQDPKMSVEEVTQEILKGMKQDYGFIVCNLAPPDMVGHTGNYEATLEAVSAVDRSIGYIYEAAKISDFAVFIVSDHGNAEIMKDKDGNIVKKHTTNRVPFIICKGSKDDQGFIEGQYTLQDVAPTILGYMGLEIPKEMTGKDHASYMNNLKEDEF